MALLEVKGSAAPTRRVTALDGADLLVEKGAHHRAVGPERRGKDHRVPTPLIAAGALRPNGGAVTIDRAPMLSGLAATAACVASHAPRSSRARAAERSHSDREPDALPARHQRARLLRAVLSTRLQAREAELRQRAIAGSRREQYPQGRRITRGSIFRADRRSCSSSAAPDGGAEADQAREPRPGINRRSREDRRPTILARKARCITFLIIEHNMGWWQHCETTWW